MTKLEHIAQKHVSQWRVGVAGHIKIEDAVTAALREWTEECAQVVERTLLVHASEARCIAHTVRMLAKEEA